MDYRKDGLLEMDTQLVKGVVHMSWVLQVGSSAPKTKLEGQSHCPPPYTHTHTKKNTHTHTHTHTHHPRFFPTGNVAVVFVFVQQEHPVSHRVGLCLFKNTIVMQELMSKAPIHDIPTTSHPG